jgi:serine/threonine protein kinase
MPPEMIFANKAIGWPHSNIIQPKSDIYALAVTYYELIELAILPEKKHIFPSRSKPIYPYPDFTDPIIEFKLAMLRKTDNNNLYNIIKSNLHNFRTPKATAQIIALAIQKTLQSNPSLRPQTVADLMTDLNL